MLAEASRVRIVRVSGLTLRCTMVECQIIASRGWVARCSPEVAVLQNDLKMLRGQYLVKQNPRVPNTVILLTSDLAEGGAANGPGPNSGEIGLIPAGQPTSMARCP